MGGITAEAIEDMRSQWRNNPAMPAYQRLLFDEICNMANASRSPAQPEGVTDAWQRIDHPHRPREADYEVDRLKQRLEKFPGAVVETLTTWALMAPDQGSYAGALWALAEWAATRALRSKP